MKLRGMMAAAAVMAMVLAGCSPSASAAQETGSKAETTAAEPTAAETAASEATTGMSADTADGNTLHHVKIHVKDYGTITVELDSQYAPITVENFLKLAQSGFYDGLTFHRIIDGFMIQGGDPQGTGLGGAAETIKGEFSKNGVENPVSHKRGVISMARSREMDSASSQFFIVHQDSPHLDGSYAAFGAVTEGMEIVDQICKDTAVTDKNGSVAAENRPVMEKVEVID